MKLLVVNFEMNENAVTVAWQARVVRELAKQCESVVVLTDRVGSHSVPANVSVEEFRRPALLPRLAMIAQTWRACRALRPDAVFIHMAHLKAVLFWPVFAALRLPVLLWYAHGAVTWHLRLAHACVDRVISSTPEGFHIPSRKAHFIGQGVDTDLFALRPASAAKRDLITVARISRSKRLDLLIAAMEHLRADGLRLRIIGVPLTDADRAYEAELRDRVSRLGLPVEFAGFVPLEALPPFYDAAALHVNLSQTNSLDKAPLEALACGCPVMTSNPAFRALLADYPALVIRDERPEAIAAQVREFFAQRAEFPPEKMRALVAGRHDLRSYAGRILEHLRALSRA
ncbi:MAG: glycosyltransferase family 4 protein [Verrucomicrobia bacterium]|nr:glycosyltransferase family 4 protein [Verrucomicrobiota bacterium]